MKRDMNLIRELLLHIENSNDGRSCLVFPPKDYSAEETDYHLLLLRDAGFIEANVAESFDGTSISVKRMTWEGHDFLDAIRPTQVWDRVQGRITGVMDSAAFEIVKRLAVQEGLKLFS